MISKIERKLLNELYSRYKKIKTRDLWRATEAYVHLSIEGDLAPIHDSDYITIILDGTHECFKITTEGIRYMDNLPNLWGKIKATFTKNAIVSSIIAILIATFLIYIFSLIFSYGKDYFSEPSILMNISETTEIQINQSIFAENFFFITQNALGWIVSMKNINDPRTGGRIGVDTDLISNLALCDNCSLYYIYIENNGESSAKNIEIEIMNDSVQEDTIDLKTSFGGTKEDVILKCNQSESLCILEIYKLKSKENVTLTFIGKENGINPQCQVDNNSTSCSKIDYIDIGIASVSPDFQVELGMAGSSDVIEIPPLPKFESSVNKNAMKSTNRVSYGY